MTLTFCSNDCGFYANPGLNGLCSSCHKNETKNQQHIVASEQHSIVPHSSEEIQSNQKGNDISNLNNEVIRKDDANCCEICHKRKGGLISKCKCEKQFCLKHLDPQEHKCNFDFKLFYQKQLADRNPRIVSAKVNKI